MRRGGGGGVNGYFSRNLNRRRRGVERGEFLIPNGLGPGIVIGKFGRKGALIRFRGNSIDVDLNDLRSGNKIFSVIGCDGAQHLHSAKAKFRIRYLVGARSLVCQAKIRNEISHRIRTTWANTDARLVHNVFFKEKTPIRLRPMSWGEGARETFLNIGM